MVVTRLSSGQPTAIQREVVRPLSGCGMVKAPGGTIQGEVVGLPIEHPTIQRTRSLTRRAEEHQEHRVRACNRPQPPPSNDPR